MDFSRFRELRGWTLERAADELKANGDERLANVTASLVRKHEAGWHMPRPVLIARYAEISEGAVTYQDWLNVRSAPKRKAEAA